MEVAGLKWIVKRFSSGPDLYIAHDFRLGVYCFVERERRAYRFDSEREANNFIYDHGLDVSWRAVKWPN